MVPTLWSVEVAMANNGLNLSHKTSFGISNYVSTVSTVSSISIVGDANVVLNAEGVLWLKIKSLIQRGDPW